MPLRWMYSVYPSSLPTRGAWIEMLYLSATVKLVWSLPTRGAWIEIYFLGIQKGIISVAPHTGSVD